MSENEILNQLLNCLEALLQRVTRMEKMLWPPVLYDREVLHVHEMAQYMGCSESWIYRLCKEERLPYSKSANGQMIFNRREIYQRMIAEAFRNSQESMRERSRTQLKALEEQEAQVEEEARLNILQMRGG